MQARFFRFVAFIAVLVACGSSKERIDTPKPTPSAAASASSVDSAAPSATASAAPQVTPPVAAWKPLLYRIDGRTAGAKPSYLFGTIHIPDERLTPNEAFKNAFHEAEEVVSEMPLDDTSPTHAMQVASMPNGKTLASELPKATYDRLKDVFVKKGIGMAFMLLEHMKVWAVAIQVTLIDHLQQLAGGAKPIDMILHDRAKELGKRTSGLETEAEQLSVFDTLTKDEQARMLEQTLDQRDKDLKEGKDPIAKLMTLYLAGDEVPLLTELNAGFDTTKPLDQKLLKRLITDRNKIMTDRIAVKIKTSPARVYLFAVGAAHLLGDDGIIAQLKKKNVAVERVQ